MIVIKTGRLLSVLATVDFRILFPIYCVEFATYCATLPTSYLFFNFHCGDLEVE